MELAATKAAQEFIQSGSPSSDDLKNDQSSGKRRYLMVVGINTAFREKRKKLEEEKGIIIRFVIGHRYMFFCHLIITVNK
uniref:Hexosyltransferase n=1 Tax=Cucumis melo TaxID=3656 RepID=A0A9I9DDI0_CUCME